MEGRRENRYSLYSLILDAFLSKPCRRIAIWLLNDVLKIEEAYRPISLAAPLTLVLSEVIHCVSIETLSFRRDVQNWLESGILSEPLHTDLSRRLYLSRQCGYRGTTRS